MGFEAFLIIACALAVLLFLVGSRLPAEEEPRETGPPPAATRWRRFRCDVDALAAGAEGAPVLEEEPEGLRAVLREGSLDELPLLVGTGDDAPPLVRLEPRALSFRGDLVLRHGQRAWLVLRPGGGGDFPELRPPRRAPPPELPALDDLALQGSLRRREYEVRWRGRLVVSVTRSADDAPGGAGNYAVEVVRNAPAGPFLALVTGLELAATRQGSPVPGVE